MESYARRGENAKGEKMQGTRDYKLTKKGETGSVRFPAFENEDGLLISPQGYPMVIADELTEAGFKPADAQLPISEVDPEILPLVLRVGDNRGNVVERIETSEERKAREKVERDNQNAFLREKGYRWEKQNFYVSGDVGDLVTRWFLIDPDGNAVVGAKDGGGYIAEFGSVKAILTGLGYYGQEAIEKAESKTKARQERREMRAKVDAYFDDDANRTGETFEDAQSQFTARPVAIEKHAPRRQFRIEADCIWYETHNRSDGDDWSLNNSDYGIARQYKFDAEIADCLRRLGA